METQIRAILFDVGGTLRTTEKVEGRERAFLEEMKAFLGFTGSIDELVQKLIGGEKAYRRWCKKSLVELSEQQLWVRFMLPDQPADFIGANAVKLNQLWRNSKGKKILLPNTIETLKELARRGYLLSIISNTTSSVEVPQLLEDNGISHLFASVILSTVYGRRKPHPSLFLDAVRDLHVHAEDCAYIGDRPSRDVVGAREAGFSKVVIIQAKGLKHENLEEVPMKPDHVISNLGELLAIFPDRKGVKPLQKEYFQPDFLYDVALSTMWGIGQKTSFADTFASGRKMGFARFELNHAVSPVLFGQIDFNLYRIGNVHDPCPATLSMNELKDRDWLISSPDEECRKKGVEVNLRSIDLAVKLGAKSVIIHPGQVNGDRSMDRRLRVLFENGLKGTAEYEELKEAMVRDRQARVGVHLDAVLRSLKEIIDYTRPLKISLGLENRYRYYDIPLLDEMQLLLDLCKEPWYGFQYDVGHAQTLSQLGLDDHETWLKRYGSRIVGTHIHDVIGITDHQAPGLGEVDFAMVASHLPADAWRTLEVGPQASFDEIVNGMEVLARFGCVAKM